MAGGPKLAQPGLAATGTLALLMLLGKAMVGPLFAQSAWNNVTFTGSEVRDPGRTLPRALLIGCGIVVTLYVLANVAYIATLPLEGIQNAPQNRVAVAAMNAILGPAGTILMAIAIMISTFGCNNGLILAGARVYYAMARDGLFFRKVARLNRSHAPAMALASARRLGFAFSLCRERSPPMPTTGAVTYGNVYTQLLEYIISADLVFYVLMVGAVIVMRRKAPTMERPYRTWGYPLVPLIYIAIAGSPDPRSGLSRALHLRDRLSARADRACPVYLVWRRRAAPPARSTNDCMLPHCAWQGGGYSRQKP